jgi:hypothetical protein
LKFERSFSERKGWAAMVGAPAVVVGAVRVAKPGAMLGAEGATAGVAVSGEVAVVVVTVLEAGFCLAQKSVV